MAKIAKFHISDELLASELRKRGYVHKTSRHRQLWSITHERAAKNAVKKMDYTKTNEQLMQFAIEDFGVSPERAEKYQEHLRKKAQLTKVKP